MITNVNDKKLGKVWIAHDRGGMDFSGAEQFGEVRTVFEGSFNPFDLHGAFAKVRSLMQAESGPNDWLVLAGSGPASALLAVAYQERWGRLPLLVFHAQERKYVKREVAVAAS